jgi:23S rRNA (uracil1939-C5)-methyltransferase
MVQTVELAIEQLGAQGDGIARWQDAKVFVPFTVPGDRIRARLGVRRAAHREARVVERLVSGPGRIEPACHHFGNCGGCALQHLDPATYRGVKLGALYGALRRVGIDPLVVEPLRTVPPGRRRARLGLFRPKENDAPPVIGFRERFRHDLIDLRECAVLEPTLFALLPGLRRVARAALTPGDAVDVALTRTDSGVDVLIEAKERPGLAALESLAIFANEHDVARIVWRARGEDVPIVERRPVRVLLSGAAVAFPAGGFLQASAVAEAILVGEVAGALGRGRPAIDLFAGLGTFTFALANAGPVHAVEGDAAAASALAKAASGATGVTVERRDLDRDPLPAAMLARYEAAVFDPPRAGALRQVAALAASSIGTIAAVSCNPATFARDAARLIAGGFRLERVVPVDQFVWTPHLELAAVFRR